MAERYTHHSLSLTAFTEKFYGCYRDGLDGGRDMRSFASFYFLLRYIYHSFTMACSCIILSWLSGLTVSFFIYYQQF